MISIKYDASNNITGDLGELRNINLVRMDFNKLNEIAYNNFISFICKLSESQYLVEKENKNRSLYIQDITFKENTDISCMLSQKHKLSLIVIGGRL
jgi:hypothetical protein